MRTPTSSQQGPYPSPAMRLPAAAEQKSARPMDSIERQEGGARLDSEISQILIVDDEPTILKLIARMAQSLGYHATTAPDALDALFHLRKRQFDLVLTDYTMPFMDGLQLADQVKRQQLSTTVIIMTGSCDKTILDMIKGSRAVDGLLSKPFNLDTMKETLESASRLGLGRWAF